MNRTTDWLDPALQSLKDQNLFRDQRIATKLSGGRVVVDGKACVNFGSNDYLDLSRHPRILEAVIAALSANGWGSGSSPLITGRSASHAELERQLATFKGTEAAVVFTSGFAANVGTIDALVGRGDTVFSDDRNHASIIDGCRISKATVVRYPHCNPSGLEERLAQAPNAGRRLIVTDSLFSMDGDLAPLRQLCELAERYDAMMMVDEAHATGVFGTNGTGCAELQDCHGKIDVHVGTLSKAFGSQGGYVAGSRKLVDWLVNRARTHVFSTAIPAVMAAAALVGIRLIRDEPQRRQELLAKADRLRNQLKLQGFNVGNSASQIIPVILGDPETTMQWSTWLAERGLLVPGIRPPTVPLGHSMLRISVTYAHDDEALQNLLDTLADLRIGSK